MGQETHRVLVQQPVQLWLQWQMLLLSSLLFATRKIFGYSFSSEKEVVDYVTEMAPLVCVNVIMDSLQCVLSAAFYLVGIPLGVTLGFWFQMRGKGFSGLEWSFFNYTNNPSSYHNNIYKLGTAGKQSLEKNIRRKHSKSW